jgi:hypothetical protein
MMPPVVTFFETLVVVESFMRTLYTRAVLPRLLFVDLIAILFIYRTKRFYVRQVDHCWWCLRELSHRLYW